MQKLSNWGAKRNLYFIFSAPFSLFKKRSRATSREFKFGSKLRTIPASSLWQEKNTTRLKIFNLKIKIYYMDFHT